jgi:hypothetical protein
MKLLGTIEIKAPELIKKLTKKGEVFFSNFDSAEEFTLNTTNGSKEKIDFEIWFNLETEDIEIMTEFDNDPNNIYDSLDIHLKDSEGHKIGLLFSLSQVRALAEIFQSYMTAYDLLQRCKGRIIKAESL